MTIQTRDVLDARMDPRVRAFMHAQPDVANGVSAAEPKHFGLRMQVAGRSAPQEVHGEGRGHRHQLVADVRQHKGVSRGVGERH